MDWERRRTGRHASCPPPPPPSPVWKDGGVADMDGREPWKSALAKRDENEEEIATHLSLSSVAQDGNKEKWTDQVCGRDASP